MKATKKISAMVMNKQFLIFVKGDKKKEIGHITHGFFLLHLASAMLAVTPCSMLHSLVPRTIRK